MKNRPYFSSIVPKIRLRKTHTSRIQLWNTINYNYETVLLKTSILLKIFILNCSFIAASMPKIVRKYSENSMLSGQLSVFGG
jgi:hypothetical protein